MAVGPTTVDGTIVEVLPRALYRVAVDGKMLTAHATTGLGRNFVRLVVGDRVKVAISVRDRTRGRILRKAGR